MDQDIIKAEMNQGIVSAQAPNILYSGGFEPCTVVSIRSPKNNIGYMLHESQLTERYFDLQMQTVQRDFSDLSELEVFVTGNSICEFEIKEKGLKKSKARQDKYRNRVKIMLEKYFDPKKIEYHWLKSFHCGELTLDLSTGNYDLKIEWVNDSQDDY